MNKIASQTVGSSPAKKRKYAGRVKRACENCKRAKRCCDNARPCSRCLRLGIEDSCRDAERKDRLESPKPVAIEPQERKETFPSKPVKLENFFFEAPSTMYALPTDDNFHILDLRNNRFSYNFQPPDLIWDLNEPILEDDSNDLFEYIFLEVEADKKRQLLEKYLRLVEEVRAFKLGTMVKKESFFRSGEFYFSEAVSIPNRVPPVTYDVIIQFLQIRIAEIERHWPEQFQSLNRFLKNEAGVWLMKQGQIINWNSFACEALGSNEYEILTHGITWRDFVHFSDWEQMENLTLIPRKTEFSHVLTLVDKLGQPFKVRATFFPLVDPFANLDLSQYLLVSFHF